MTILTNSAPARRQPRHDKHRNSNDSDNDPMATAMETIIATHRHRAARRQPVRPSMGHFTLCCPAAVLGAVAATSKLLRGGGGDATGWAADFQEVRGVVPSPARARWRRRSWPSVAARLRRK